MTRSLPFPVLRAVAQNNRFAPPLNRDHSLRAYSRAALERLKKLPPALWEINAEVMRRAPELDTIARLEPIARTPAKERLAHEAIATSLRRTAKLLREDGQLDPWFPGALVMANRLADDAFKAFIPGPGVRLDQGARLSLFLRALADAFEGDTIQFHGLHVQREGQRSGVEGAATAAFVLISEFFEKVTGKPHEALTAEIVEVYYPCAAKHRDRARTRRNRKAEASGKKKEK